MYADFCKFIQKTILPEEGESNLIYAPTSKSLRFYRNYFRKELTDVLFVGVDDPVDPEAIVSQFTAAGADDSSAE